MNLKFKLPPSSMELNFKIDKIAPPQPIRELTGALPLVFTSVGDPLIDWHIRGAAGGVGNRGINYLKQVERTMSDGGYGVRIDTVWDNTHARTITLNSGDADCLGLCFRKTDSYNNIVPANVGTITISATGIPDIVITDIYQGGISSESVGNDQRYHVGYGDDGSGRTIIYNSDNTRYIPILCKTLPIAISKNTTYTITRTGGDSDIDIYYARGKNVGEIELIWDTTRVNSIPGNQAADKNVEQWTRVETEYARITAYGANVQIDSHPPTYDNCAYYASLPSGHYKVVAECLNNSFVASAIDGDSTPYMLLIASDGTEIISKTSLFQTRAPYYAHEEYDFTLSAATDVGLYFKALHSDGYPAYVRFMIADYDVQAEQFTANVAQDNPITGVTCWEPYRHTIPIIVTSGSESTTVTVTVIDALGANDTIDFTTTNIEIPTYTGSNTITVDTEVQPSEMYIKYRRR